MPTACSICTHTESAALLAALPHTSLRMLETQYGISRSALQRHRTQGCTTRQARNRRTAPGELAHVITLLEEMKALLQALVEPREEDDCTGTAPPTIPWNRL